MLKHWEFSLSVSVFVVTGLKRAHFHQPFMRPICQIVYFTGKELGYGQMATLISSLKVGKLICSAPTAQVALHLMKLKKENIYLTKIILTKIFKHFYQIIKAEPQFR